MARKKLSEYRSKSIIFKAFDLQYVGWSITAGNVSKTLLKIKGYKSYVVKVDQAIKGRFKKGLVMLDVKEAELAGAVKQLEKEGFSSFLIEPYVVHGAADERYLSIAQHRDGIVVSCSSQGGVDIEAHSESIETFHITSDFDYTTLAEKTHISQDKLRELIRVFNDNYFVFLEVNPYFATEDKVVILDSAVEIDDAGQHFVKTWDEEDIREANTRLSKQEKIVRDLDKGSAASFNLSVINPDGSIFLLLSGGGASVVVADEVFNRGFGKQLANYGEYSGNPNLHETQHYTEQVLDLLLASKAPRKVLFIGGAVANFTDIAVTFAGVINAIEERASQLASQHVRVYVRRGGPNQEVGLENIKATLEKHGILGSVSDASITIPNAIANALEGLKK
jgi:ATP-citrate lyase beta-subunit